MQRTVVILGSLVTILVMLAGCIVEEYPARRAVVVREAPPPVRHEVIGIAPSPQHVWVQGHWEWHNRWVWVDGYWAVPPRRQGVWIPGHWEQRRRGWVWIEGHWSR
jgi:hypothetical protein